MALFCIQKLSEQQRRETDAEKNFLSYKITDGKEKFFMICDICGKKPVFSIKVAHQRMYVSGRSNRKIKPNLHSTTIFEKGVKKRVTACTRCIRTSKKYNLIRQ